MLRFESLPEPGAGPAIHALQGNQVIANGGAFFLYVETDAGVDKLLVSIDDPSQDRFGYYEIDLRDNSGPWHRLVGHLRFELDPTLTPLCLSITAVDQNGTAGTPVCHTLYIVPGGQRGAAGHRVVGCDQRSRPARRGRPR